MCDPKIEFLSDCFKKSSLKLFIANISRSVFALSRYSIDTSLNIISIETVILT
jgi:hypothetical protein